MKGLSAMVRLSKWQLDEARKVLAASEQAIEGINHALKALEQEIVSQQQVILDPSVSQSYGAYAQAAIARRKTLQAERDEAIADMQEKRAIVEDAFIELKKYETLAERERVRAAEIASKREQADLDEIAITRHVRKQDSL